MAYPYPPPPPMSYSPVGGSDTGAAPPSAASRSVSELPQSQVDAIIRTKRKAREPKACYPCHARKVKCDRNLPCDGCVKRDHADLCSYERPVKKRSGAASGSADGAGASAGAGGAHSYQKSPVGAHAPDSAEDGGGTIPVKQEAGAGAADAAGASSRMASGTGNSGAGVGSNRRVSIAREEWDNVRNRLRDMEKTISSLRVGLDRAEDGYNGGGQGSSMLETGSQLSGDTSSRSKGASPEREGIHAANTLGEGTVHLGSRSVLAYILNNKSGSDQLQALLEGGILPKLGLDNESATYPFVDLWSSDMSTFDVSAVCSALPGDQQCKEFFYYYRDIAGAIYPVLEDVHQFERKMDLLLQNRASTGGMYRADLHQTQRPFGVSIAFLGLLFAMLASGCQSSDLPSKERELTSQVYVCCSYQCLRMTNFLSQPTIEAIQTLLIIGNVLSYNMNPGISYVLLGMTLRMGLALGLHVESSRFLPAERYRRRHVWWSMAWQDSHFSLSYDRPSTTAVSQPEIAYREDSTPGELSYFETLCRVIALALEVVRSRMLSPHSQMAPKTIQAYKERIQKIMIEAKPGMRDRKYCLTATEHLERVVLKLHSSYFASEICRPALKSPANTSDPVISEMRADCVKNLMKTVEAYVEMHSISSHAARSWITLQRAISSIFLLAVSEESKSNPQFWALLQQLKHIIAERAHMENDYDSNDPAAAAAAAAAAATGQMTSPIPGTTAPPASATMPGATDRGSVFNPIPGTATNTTSASPNAINATSPVPAAVAADTQTQWAKPLTKTLRALEKLEAAFSNQGTTSATNTPSSRYGTAHAHHPHQPHPHPHHQQPPPPPTTDPTTAAATAYLNPNGMAGGGGGVFPATTVSGIGSLPPPTPDSSTSGEWTIPNILDRAAEYIHPPLWG